MPDQEDPFKKYGGQQIEDPTDPFKKYGGKAIDVKKKETLLPVGGQAGSFNGLLGGVTKVAAGVMPEEDEEDPLGNILSSKERELAPILYPDVTTGKPHRITPQQQFQANQELGKATSEVYNTFTGNRQAAEGFIKKELEKKGVSANNIQTIKENYNPKNLTQKLAVETLEDINDIETAVSQKGSIEDAAVQYFSLKDDGTGRQAKFLDKEVPNIVKGEWVDRFIHSPNVVALAENHVGLKEKLIEAENTLYDKFPEYGFKKVRQILGQARENKGMNSLLANNPSVEKTEELAQDLLKNGRLTQKEYEVWDKQIKPLLGAAHSVGGGSSVIPTVDFREAFSGGATEGFDGIVRTIKHIGAISDPERKKQLTRESIVKEYSTLGISPSTEFGKVVSTSGHLTGFLTPMLLGGMVRIPSLATNTAMFMGHNADNAMRMFPGNQAKQDGYTILTTGADVFLGEFLPGGSKAAKQGLSKGISTLINKFSNKEITADVAKKSFIDGVTKYVTNVAGKNLKTGGIVTGFGVIHNAADVAFGGRDLSLTDIVDEAAEQLPYNFLGATPLSLMHSAGRNKSVNSETIRRLVENPESENVIKEKNDPEITANFQKAKEAWGEIKEFDIKEENKGDYLLKDLQQKVFEQKAKEAKVSVNKEKWEKLAKEAGIEKAFIYYPETGLKSLMEEFYDEEIIPKQDRVLIENNETGKYEPNKAGEYLKFIAQQSNGLTADWKPAKGGKPTMENYPPLLVELANEKYAKEIEAAQPKAEPDLGFDPETNQATSTASKGEQVEGKEYSENLVTPIDKPEQISVKKLMGEKGVSFSYAEKKEALTESISKEGVKVPIIVNKETGEIIDGTHRLLVANETGQKEIPVIYVKGLERKDNSQSREKLINDVVEKYSQKPTVDETAPIRQLGTGANVYFETKKYRVNDDIKSGKVLLNIGDAKGEVPLKSVEFKDAKEAVFVAKKLEENAPKGLDSDYHNIDKIIDDFRDEYKNQDNLGGKEKGVTSPRYGKAENITGKEAKGASNTAGTSAEESPEKLNKRYERVTDEYDLVDPYDVAVKYFADGGKINPSELERIFGGKGDKGARISLMKNNAGTVKQIAHFLWESDQSGKYEDTHYIDAVESALRDAPSKSAMQKNIVDRYDLQDGYEKHLAQKGVREDIDIVERMTEEEMNEVLRRDAENSPDRDKFLDEIQSQNENKTKSIKADESKPTEEVPPIKTASTEAGEGAGKEPPTGEGKVAEGEGDIAGITHAANEVRRKDRALPEYEKEPKTFEAWNNEAEKQIKEGYDVEKLMDKIEAGHDPTPVENSIRKIYIATLDAEIAKNPTDALLAKQKRFIEIGDLANSRAGRNLVSLKGENSPLSSISDFYVAKMEAAGVDKLTEQQKKETKEAFDNVQKADENATAAMEAYREEIAKLKAENELLKQKKTTPKKDKGDWAQQRKDAVEGAREALKKIRTGEAGLTVRIPVLNELIAIAPHVKKYVGSLLGEGAANLKEVVSKAYNEFKDILEGLTEKHIHDIIAGEYNKPLPTRNELAAKMRDLRDEAYYINKLERLLAGTEPKSEKKKVERNRQITELQQKIADFRKAEREAAKEPKEEVPDEIKKLAAIKKRNEKEAEEIKERIRKGEFEKEKKVPFLEDPEMQRKFPKEYKAALDAIVKKEEARHEFDIALLKDQMSKRSIGKKGIDIAGDVLGTTRALTTGIDASGIGIQNIVGIVSHPRSSLGTIKPTETFPYFRVEGGALPKSFLDFVSAKTQDRWLAKVHSSKLYPLSQKFGLDITEPQSLKASQKEEAFSHNLLDRRIKFKGKNYVISKYITKPFERIFTGLGNRMRWNLWERGVEKLFDDGFTPEKHPEEFKSLATVLNTETGRGTLHPQMQKAYPFITSIIWSPRLMASRLNILGLGDLFNATMGKKGYYGGLTPRMREYAIKDFAKFVAFGTLALTLAGVTFADDVDTDPNSAGFGTFLANGKRYNIWGGFTQYVRLSSAMALGGEKRGNDWVRSNQLKTGLRFLWGKTTPVAGTGISLLNKDHKDYMGKTVTTGGAIENLTVPLSIRGIAKGIKNEGLGSIIWTGVPSFVGMNVSYESDHPFKAPFKIKDPETFKEIDPTEEQVKAYEELKEKKYPELIKEYENLDSEMWLDTNGKIHISKGSVGKDEFDTWEEITPKKLTKEQKVEFEKEVKKRAAREAKKELFGEENE